MVILVAIAAFLAGVATGLTAWSIERFNAATPPWKRTGPACDACGSHDLHPGFYHDWCGKCGKLAPPNTPPRRELSKKWTDS